MRMTNKIMRSNSLYNINQNKILEDKLTNQMTNQSKIARPSDDPVVAIRALRLRSNVSTITQYHDKNADDAESWLTITADALTTIDEILKNLYEQAGSAANKDLTSDDLEILMSQMRSLTNEFYSSGNVDFAGRYVFSGFRTDTPITFTSADEMEMEKHPVSYEIHENFSYADISTINYTNYDVLSTTIAGDGINADNTSYEQSVTNNTLYRIRLSYNAVDGTGMMMPASNSSVNIASLPVKRTAMYQVDAKGELLRDGSGNLVPDMTLVDRSGTALTDKDGTPLFGTSGDPEYSNGQSLKDGAGNLLDEDGNAILDKDGNPVAYNSLFDGSIYEEYAVFDEAEEAYQAVSDPNSNVKGMAFIPSTGEIVFSGSYYNNFKEGNSFQITYNKSNWAEKDINPVHYFECIETKDIGDGSMKDVKKTAYNITSANQDIYYDVGFNQQIQVNTVATEVFTHGVMRDMDDFDLCLTQLRGIETTISDIEKKIKEYPEGSDDYKNWSKKLEGAKKAQTYIRENIHSKFENQITNYQSYSDENNIAITNNATRGSRLDLITTRLSSQKETFKDLQTDNEGIDITQVAVELSSSELTYQAALMATGKIMQTSLMNYI
ncbi:MAG: hypothetical protein NC416_05475 [Eubacterium sp.]|nr:hypothetical protein [Eubacterium sp.]